VRGLGVEGVLDEGVLFEVVDVEGAAGGAGAGFASDVNGFLAAVMLKDGAMNVQPPMLRGSSWHHTTDLKPAYCLR